MLRHHSPTSMKHFILNHINSLLPTPTDTLTSSFHSSNTACISSYLSSLLGSSIFYTNHKQHLASLLHRSPLDTHFTPWIIDIGATDHMVCSTSFFISITCTTQAYVQVPNKTQAKVTHVGTVKIFKSLILTDVFCIPTFTFNLISASKLTHSFSLCLIFLNNLYFIQALSSWMTIGLAKVHNDLYFLLPSSLFCKNVNLPISSSNSQVLNSNAEHHFDLWNFRLGHPSQGWM